MPKVFALVVVLTLAATDTFAADTAAVSGPDPYASPLEQCIRDNAAKVDAAVADINQAVDFLVGKICAVPLAEANATRAREIQVRSAQRLQRMCDDQATAKAQAKPDDAKPAANGPAIDYCQLAKNLTALTDRPLPAFDAWTTNAMFPGGNPAAAVGLASRLLLDLRYEHKHHGT